MDVNGDSEFGQWSKASEDVLRMRFPLHRACRDGDMENLSLLLVSGQINLLQEDEFYGWTPAHWAAYFGQLACLRRIMQVLSVEPSTSRYQQTPAHLAAFAGHPHCLQWLMRTGSNLDTKDYMGETPVHKAARTGSMECLSLMAADNANLSTRSNSGMTPPSLAAKCGYVDCALYLNRAAEQQQLKMGGVIHEMVLPVIPTESILPGQKPDRCVITQGINGGRLPSSIDPQHIPSPIDNSDMEMDVQANNKAMNGHIVGYGLNTTFNQTNGHLPHNGFHHGLNGCNGLNGAVKLHKDVLLSTDVARNITPVAGRKRTREEVDDGMTDDMKRIRCLETGEEPVYKNTLNNWIPPAVHCSNTSAIEHESYLIAQQGYDSMMIDTMLLECHGA